MKQICCFFLALVALSGCASYPDLPETDPAKMSCNEISYDMIQTRNQLYQIKSEGGITGQNVTWFMLSPDLGLGNSIIRNSAEGKAEDRMKLLKSEFEARCTPPKRDAAAPVQAKAKAQEKRGELASAVESKAYQAGCRAPDGGRPDAVMTRYDGPGFEDYTVSCADRQLKYICEMRSCQQK
jgi:hypothetical protein